MEKHDYHDIVEFPFEGEILLGIVIKHYDHPLNDFYLIYADCSLYEYTSKDDYSLLADNMYMPIYERALTEYKLKKQHIKDMVSNNRDFNALLDTIQHMDKSIFL